jgi:N utilization substance protein A
VSLLTTPSKELLQYVEMIANERLINQDLIFDALEDAFVKTVHDTTCREFRVSVKINRKDGSINVSKLLEVVEGQNYDIYKQIDLASALQYKKDAALGDVIELDIPAFDLNPSVMHQVRSSLFFQLNQYTRENEYKEFTDLIGTMVSGIVKRILPSGLVVILGKAEALLPKRDMLVQEVGTYKVKDKINVLVKSTERLQKGFQIFVTRTAPEFVTELLKQEVPEIADGNVEVKCVARDAGSRSKIAVFASDRNLDPVGTCIGVRGKRIKNITKELKEEKIDIVEWSPEPVSFVQNCLKGIPVEGIERTSDTAIEVVLLSESVSTAIGRRGQNARLISELTGFNVTFSTKEERVQRKSKEFELKTKTMSEVLGVDEVVAGLLISEGYDTLMHIAIAEIENLSKIPNFNAEIAQEVKNRAGEILNDAKDNEFSAFLLENGICLEIVFALFANECADKASLAALSVDDFIDIAGEDAIKTFAVSNDAMSKVIMLARQELGLI